MFKQDRKFIENKYHKTDEPFNPYARMACHGYDYDNGTGLEDQEIKEGLSRIYEKIKVENMHEPLVDRETFYTVSNA